MIHIMAFRCTWWFLESEEVESICERPAGRRFGAAQAVGSGSLGSRSDVRFGRPLVGREVARGWLMEG